MIRNYRLGDNESLDLTLTDVGSSNFQIKQDGVYSSLFSEMQLWSDSGRTTPLSPADWEYYTTDDAYTALEAGSGGSGLTIYSEIRILNATYQTGSIYATYTNFGTYTNGIATGREKYSLTDDDTYSFAEDEFNTYFVVASGTGASKTLTLTNNGADERNIFTARNDSSNTYTFTDGTNPWIVGVGETQRLTWDTAGLLVPYFSSGEACAWVVFNGATQAIANGHNVASISRTSAGRFTITFTNQMDVNTYTLSGTARYTSATLAGGITQNSTSTKTTAAVEVYSINVTAGLAVDSTEISILIHGGY